MTSLHHHVAKKKVKRHLASSQSTRNHIDEAGKESFPSSDPPAWTLGSDHQLLLSREEKSRDLGYILTQEHLTIRHVVHAIMEMLESMQNGKQIDMSLLATMSDFFIHYVDRCHHKKEEMIFAAMREGEERPSDYILNDLLREHEHGKEIHSSLATWIANKKHDPRELMTILKGMINLHHNHTNKEEEYIFPLINKVMNEEKREQFLREFKKIEGELGGDHYAKLVEFSKRIK